MTDIHIDIVVFDMIGISILKFTEMLANNKFVLPWYGATGAERSEIETDGPTLWKLEYRFKWFGL